MLRAKGCSILLGFTLLACRERADVESPRIPVAARRLSVAPALIAAQPSSTALAVVPVAAEPAATAAQPEAPLVLAAGGDVNFGRECGQAIIKDPAYDPFVGLNQAWTGADLRFVNLESQLSDQNGVTQSPGNRLIFTGPPGGADVLAHACVSLVSTANNHAWDYGKSALLETIDNLTRTKVPFAGTGRNAEEAYRPLLVRAKGLSVALFAVTHIWNQGNFADHEGRDYVAWADVDKLKSAIEQARRENDFVIISYHGGEEYIDAPVERTRRFVKAAMALGVDAIIGHHPHVPQGVGFVEGERPVLYSLGNFVFAGHDNRPWTKQSFFARLTLERGKPPRVAACPFVLEGHRPRSFRMPDGAYLLQRFRQHLIDVSTSVGGANVEGPDELGCLPVTPKR